MPVWVEVFIVVAAVSIVIQTLVMVSTLLLLRPVILRFAQIASDFQVKMQPILATTTRILADSEDRIKSIMADTAEITQTARQEAQKVDRVVTEALDKLRLQIIRTDQLITGALEATQEAGTKMRRTVLGPVNQISALLKGLKVGLDVIRGNRHSNPDGGGIPQDEELFI
jgi:uncharacterized membrane-anchored protein YhcB (DUF1043 family)